MASPEPKNAADMGMCRLDRRSGLLAPRHGGGHGLKSPPSAPADRLRSRPSCRRGGRDAITGARTGELADRIMKIVDLSHVMNVEPGWVGYAGNKMYYAQNLQTQRIETALHVGTHFDGAMHATDGRKGDMASLPLDYLFNRGAGQCRPGDRRHMSRDIALLPWRDSHSISFAHKRIWSRRTWIFSSRARPRW
jgi:hypothetical protein